MAISGRERGSGGSQRRPNYPIESVDNVLRLLLMVVDQKQVRVSDVSAELGTAVSTAHRLLAMLAHHGFVVQNLETKAYEQGPVLMKVGLAAVRNLDVRVLLRPVIQALRDDVGETVHLAVVHGAETLFIDCAESPVALRVASRVGTSMWAHCTSAGKAWLACQSDAVLKELFPSSKLQKLTVHSIGSRSTLLTELAEVRRLGFARSTNESELGVGSVSAAVRDRTGAPLASITVSVPLVRMSEQRWPELAEAVLGARRQAEELIP